ncbi:hypothetical protein [Xylanibacter muris]|nr:hypothetical protein [Xylanibacter muris]
MKRNVGCHRTGADGKYRLSYAFVTVVSEDTVIANCHVYCVGLFGR